MTKKLIIISTLALLLFHSPALVSAETSTDSAAQIRDAVQKKVAEQLATIKKAVAKRGFVGTISAKTDSTITIINLANQSRTATVTASTTIKLTGGKEGTPTDLKIGDFVIAMGDVDSDNTMTTSRLLVISKPDPDKHRAIFGKVTTATTSSITIETTNKDTWTVKVLSSTKITTPSENDLVTAKLSQIKEGSKVVILGNIGASDNTLTALRINLLPQ